MDCVGSGDDESSIFFIFNILNSPMCAKLFETVMMWIVLVPGDESGMRR